ncbi:hypothetical protein BON30_44095 [Cystobacter ferrugineus]|uniref:Pre ATP-grasp domain-containing protein n=2 Tax=Cystobacter ferrugineus TaxID=83449 RepID=A0A1L9AWB1_9BACT|nr:hypothetical protein BON30_44095 [Cystobacter ferrugineus]
MELEPRLAPYRELAWDEGSRDWPVLHLEDLSGMPFMTRIPGVEKYQHRARVRARTGDFVAATTAVTPGYEEYCRERLGLGAPEFVMAEPVGHPLAVARACQQGAAFHRLTAVARAAGGLTVHPYMGIEDAWSLARKIADASKVPVRVLAPPPPVTWLANDKALFSELVASVLGEKFLVETYRARDAETLATKLLALARRHERVGLKRTRSASSMGNEVHTTAAVRASGPAAARALVDAFLKRTEWQGDEDILVVAWLETDVAPSAQLWIPPISSGPPRLKGIYEQILTGPAKVFVGSRPSTLPARVNEVFGRACLRLGAALQSLGYVGCCSFDALVLGDCHGDFDVRINECNGRWGGTSTPMFLVDRLCGAPRPAYVAMDHIDPEIAGTPFPVVLSRVGEHLYDPSACTGRYIFYNAGPLEDKGKLDVIALGATPDDAQRALADVGPLLRASSRG